MNKVVPLKTRIGFDRLMDAYERNYLALRMLLPDLENWPDNQVNILRSAMQCDPMKDEHKTDLNRQSSSDSTNQPNKPTVLPELLVKVLERHVYTTDVWLSYQLIGSADLPIYVPDFSVRIYHDAQQAEVLQGTLKDHWKIKITDDVAIHSRWIVNHTLDVWLQHLRQKGYQHHAEINSDG